MNEDHREGQKKYCRYCGKWIQMDIANNHKCFDKYCIKPLKQEEQFLSRYAGYKVIGTKDPYQAW